MGYDVIGQAIMALHFNGIWAKRGYPGSLMPHVTNTVVAVNMYRSTPEGDTLVATICAPMSKGVYACEDMASQVHQIWENKGATITYGGHSFDGKSGLYQAVVYGFWPKKTEAAEEEL